MDPDEALARLLVMAAQVELMDTIADSNVPDYAAEMAAIVLDLDEWFAKGGFVPKRWREGKR